MGIRQTFIENLKYYRKLRGITQEQLAEILDMSTSYVGAIEACGRFPSPETIDKIADALDVRTSALFDEFGSPENVKSTFRKIYATTLRAELTDRVVKAINETCDLI